MKIKGEILSFILDNMGWVGFGNYSVAIKEVKKCKLEATISVSEIGQDIVLTIPLSFYKKSTIEQINILLHELIHGRESLRQQRVDKYVENIKYLEEEKCMNDITMLAQKWSVK